MSDPPPYAEALKRKGLVIEVWDVRQNTVYSCSSGPIFKNLIVQEHTNMGYLVDTHEGLLNRGFVLVKTKTKSRPIWLSNDERRYVKYSMYELPE